MSSICLQVRDAIKHRLDEILKLRHTGRLKGDNTFVSDGDLLCDSIVHQTLLELVPDIKIISEEAINDLSDIDRHSIIATVDPIDGTENFVSGLKEWGVGVSIYQNGIHSESMIYLPELDIVLATGQHLERVANSRICGLSSYMKPDDFALLDGDFEYRIMGCCMYNMYNTIKGSYNRFTHLKGCYSWDILPGLNIALEHGLEVAVNGKPYNGEFFCLA